MMMVLTYFYSRLVRAPRLMPVSASRSGTSTTPLAGCRTSSPALGTLFSGLRTSRDTRRTMASWRLSRMPRVSAIRRRRREALLSYSTPKRCETVGYGAFRWLAPLT